MKRAMVFLSFLAILFSATTALFGQPAVSDEAKRHFDRGTAAVEMAKTPEDYESAIMEFKQAVQLAPDWPDVYYNLGMVQEKTGKYGEAIINLKNYIRLSPNASDAESVKSFINKMEYKRDREEGVKKVYDAMATGSCRKNLVGDFQKTGDAWLLISPYGLAKFRNVTGTLEVQVMDPDEERTLLAYHPGVRPPIPREWEPVQVNGKSFEYSYISYMDVSTGYVVRMDNTVNGEVVSVDPPRTKETLTVSVTWGAPIPGDRDSRGPWTGTYKATSEGLFEWQAK